MATSSQESLLDVNQIRTLLQIMEETGNLAFVDWTNRTIRILSAPKLRKDIIMSDGKPMQYQDIIYELPSGHGTYVAPKNPLSADKDRPPFKTGTWPPFQF